MSKAANKSQLLAATALAAVLFPSLSRADSVSDLKVELAIIQSQIHDLQAQSRSYSPAKRDELAQIKSEVAQLKVQLAQVQAQPPRVEVVNRDVAPPPAAAAPAGAGVFLGATTTMPKGVIKPKVGGVLLYAGHGGAFFVDGDIDAGLRYDTGTGHSILSVQSGLMRASRLTFEGYQDVFYGLRVVGVIEGGLNIATGTGASNPAAAGNAFDFGRESFAGIGSDKIGYIDFGRQYSPIWAVSAAPWADPFAGNYLGGIVALDPTMAVNSRVSNAITYNYGYTWEGMLDPSPPVGFGFAALYAPGGNNGTSADPVNAGQQFGVSASYGMKKWWIGAGYDQIDGWNTTDAPYSNTYFPPLVTNKTTLMEETVAASYVTPLARLFVQYNNQTDHRKTAVSFNPNINGGVEQDDFFVGFVAPTFAHQKLLFSYGKLYNYTNQKSQYSMEQMSYEYDLVQAPGTALYLEGMMVQNSARSAQGILGAANVITTPGPTTVLPDQLSKNGATPDYGATSSSIAAGVRFIF